MALEAIRYESGRLLVLDQLLLPHATSYIPIRHTKDAWTVIKNMQVRGAPAIGVVGSLSVAVELQDTPFSSVDQLVDFVAKKLAFLVSARPTAVNMQDCQRKLTSLARTLAQETDVTIEDVRRKLIAAIEVLPVEDVATNIRMSDLGADHLLRETGDAEVVALTHCNTGSLATVGYGTALGVIRSLHGRGKLSHVYCTETRPYNQGARLTAFELVHEHMPGTLVCDSMAAALMRSHGVTVVLVGADRVVANGDTANKVGTYQLAVVARHHGVPFYVVAPSTSVDLSLPSGDDIVIEERPHKELTHVQGVRIAAPGIGVWNPAFDVTPAELITGIITEFGVFAPADLQDEITRELGH